MWLRSVGGIWGGLESMESISLGALNLPAGCPCPVKTERRRPAGLGWTWSHEDYDDCFPASPAAAPRPYPPGGAILCVGPACPDLALLVLLAGMSPSSWSGTPRLSFCRVHASEAPADPKLKGPEGCVLQVESGISSNELYIISQGEASLVGTYIQPVVLLKDPDLLKISCQTTWESIIIMAKPNTCLPL